MRILVVEDSEKLRRAIQFALRKAGYAVDATGDGAEGLWFAESNDYDALVLDLMLPGLDGLTVLRRLRDGGRDTPVLILTVKSEVTDRVAGLRAGADDYLSKPFAFDELLARVEALVRRRYGQKCPLLRIGGLAVDTGARKVSHGGRDVPLTAREYRLLELLARRAGEVVSRSEIEAHIYADDIEVFSNAVESAISTLRRKLESSGGATLIHTRRGLGYVLEVKDG
jgi:DNA-binding response OmpR family regulator